MDISGYQRMQSDFDDQYFDLRGESCFDQVRHILLHLSCTVGKLARLCEKHEHALLRDKGAQFDMAGLNKEVMMAVIPDLFIHSLQLAACMDVRLNEIYIERLKENQKKKR